MTPPTGAPAGLPERRRALGAALALGFVIPCALLLYAVYGLLVPLLDLEHRSSTLWVVHLLASLTVALMAVGGAALWKLASGAPLRPKPGPKPATPDATGRADEVGDVMTTFSRMLGTIEEQADEIEKFAKRLDTAHQDLQSTNIHLKELSFKDEVTRLYNRRFFSIRLEEEVSRFRRFNHPVSLVLLDLDGFKAINDELGHAAGDETLQDVAEILLRYSRGINVICRYGGDEFAVLLVETPKDGARLYADRIRHVLSIHAFAHGRRLTASFGLAALPEDVAPSADDLVNAADEALYAAKRAGKNRVSVYEEASSPDTAPPLRLE